MSADVNTLVEMGFSENKAQRALAKTGYKGVQVAMDWLFAHEDDADIDEPFETPKGHVLGKVDDKSEAPDGASSQPDVVETERQSGEGENQNDAPVATAKSLKCDDCGKILRDVDEAEFHAAKTNHANFSESTDEKKELTAEEKEAQMQKLQEMMQRKKQERVEQERKEKITKEKMRRVQGRDMGEAKARMEELEMKKVMEQRKKEKQEEKLARQKVREQIEKDKRERAAKFPKHGTQPAEPAAASPPAQPAPAQPSQPKEYSQCRIQIRLTNGQTLTQTFHAKEELASVRLYVETHRTDDQGPFNFMTSFPRKVFTTEDMEKPLAVLGLVPSAVLIVTKPK